VEGVGDCVVLLDRCFRGTDEALGYAIGSTAREGKRPEVNDLVAMGVSKLEFLAWFEVDVVACASWDSGARHDE